MQAHRQTLKDYFGHILKDEGQRELASLLDVQEVRVRRQEKRMQIQAQTNQLFLPVWRKTLAVPSHADSASKKAGTPDGG